MTRPANDPLKYDLTIDPLGRSAPLNTSRCDRGKKNISTMFGVWIKLWKGEEREGKGRKEIKERDGEDGVPLPLKISTTLESIKEEGNWIRL